MISRLYLLHPYVCDFFNAGNLTVWQNGMSGVIPDSLYELSQLEVLFLQDNDPGFKGSIKIEIRNLKQLTHFVVVSGNPITGTLPTELGLCEELGEFYGYCIYLVLTCLCERSSNVMCFFYLIIFSRIYSSP